MYAIVFKLPGAHEHVDSLLLGVSGRAIRFFWVVSF